MIKVFWCCEKQLINIHEKSNQRSEKIYNLELHKNRRNTCIQTITINAINHSRTIMCDL